MNRTDTTTAAPSPIAGRVPLLLAAIRRQRGEWTTARVQRLYRRLGDTDPHRATARHDLALLHRKGHLTLRETTGRRCYIPTSGGGLA